MSDDLEDQWATFRQAFAAVPEDDEDARDRAHELLGEVIAWGLHQDGSIFATSDLTAGYLVTLDRSLKDADGHDTLTALLRIKGVIQVEPVPHDRVLTLAENRAKIALMELAMERMRG